MQTHLEYMNAIEALRARRGHYHGTTTALVGDEVGNINVGEDRIWVRVDNRVTWAFNWSGRQWIWGDVVQVKLVSMHHGPTMWKVIDTAAIVGEVVCDLVWGLDNPYCTVLEVWPTLTSSGSTDATTTSSFSLRSNRQSLQVTSTSLIPGSTFPGNRTFASFTTPPAALGEPSHVYDCIVTRESVSSTDNPGQAQGYIWAIWLHTGTWNVSFPGASILSSLSSGPFPNEISMAPPLVPATTYNITFQYQFAGSMSARFKFRLVSYSFSPFYPIPVPCDGATA